jgi:HD superfamily phosphodiesterase
MNKYGATLSGRSNVVAADPYELRIIAVAPGKSWRVEAAKVSDDKAALIAKDIAAKIKSDLDYPGQIKVTVIREMRAVEYAR